MKEKILKLKSEGKTYKEIKDLLGCSKGTISYHCGNGQKGKTKIRRDKGRENIIKVKTDAFKYTNKKIKETIKKEVRSSKDVVESIRKFQKRNKSKVDKNINTSFTWGDIIKKFGQKTVCYLSGEEIDLYKNTYNFDHIIPASRGGLNTLDNLGVLSGKVNIMKTDMTPEELIEVCVKILRHNGYIITK